MLNIVGVEVQSDTGVTSIQIPTGALGIAEDDYVLLLVGSSADTVITPPAGFSAVVSQGGADGAFSYGKLASNSEPSDYEVQCADSSDLIAGVIVLRSYAGIPVAVDVALGRNNSTPGTNQTFSFLSTTRADCRMIYFMVGSASSTFAPEFGLIEHWDEATANVSSLLASEHQFWVGDNLVRTATSSASITSKALTIAIAEDVDPTLYLKNYTGFVINGTSVAVTKPPNVTEGNLLTMQISLSTGHAVTPPTGWQLIREVAVGTGSPSVRLYGKIATVSEPTSYIFTFPTTVRGGAIMEVWHSTDGYNIVIDDSNGQINSSGSFDRECPSVDVTRANARLSCHITNAPDDEDILPDDRMAVVVEFMHVGVSTYATAYAMVGGKENTGSTGTRTATGSDDTSDSVAITVAIAEDIPIVQPGPQNLTATPLDTSRIRLEWTFDTPGASFVIERSLNGVSGWTVIATVGPDVFAYIDTNLPANTQFCYRVRAFLPDEE